MLKPACRRSGDSLLMRVRVQPGASHTELVGIHGDAFRIRLRSLPVEGRANKELIRFLAGLFDVPRASVEIKRGSSSRIKSISISGPEIIPTAIRQHIE